MFSFRFLPFNIETHIYQPLVWGLMRILGILTNHTQDTAQQAYNRIAQECNHIQKDTSRREN